MTVVERDVPLLAVELGMEPHPEGGWFVRTWAAGTTVETPGGTRPTATLIHFLLPAGEVSAWHVVTSDEIWLWHGPGELALQLGGTGDGPDAAGPIQILGPGVDERPSRFQVLVPANTWQRTLPGDSEVLVSALVSPGFDYADWTLFAGDVRLAGTVGEPGRQQ